MDTGTSPYTDILEAIGVEGARRASAGALRLYLGTVTRVQPLEVTVNGTPQRAEDGKLWCNSALLHGCARTARLDDPAGELDATLSAPSGTIGASVNCALGGISQLTANGSGSLSGTISANGSGSLSGTLTLTDHGFAVGDTLLLLSPDQQTFFILCKEVHL